MVAAIAEALVAAWSSPQLQAWPSAAGNRQCAGGRHCRRSSAGPAAAAAEEVGLRCRGSGGCCGGLPSSASGSLLCGAVCSSAAASAAWVVAAARADRRWWRLRLRRRSRVTACRGRRRKKSYGGDDASEAVRRQIAGVEVQDTADGRGKCLVVSRDVAAGATVLEEAPLFVWPPGWHTRRILIELQKLPGEIREAMLTLSWVPPKDEDDLQQESEVEKLLGVLRANAIKLPFGGSTVCLTVSRANHVCQPNALLRPAASGHVSIVALKALSSGEEVLVSYLPEDELLRPTSFRRRELRRGPWGFRCQCERCFRQPDTVRGLHCAACGRGVVFPAAGSGGAWTTCEVCGAESDGKTLSAAESECRSQSSVQLQDPLVTYARLCGRGAALARERHWLAAEAAYDAAKAFLVEGRLSEAAGAARQVFQFVRRARPGVLSASAAEASWLRARVLQDASERSRALGRHASAERLQAAAYSLCNSALQEALPVVGEDHDLAQNLMRMLDGTSTCLLIRVTGLAAVAGGIVLSTFAFPDAFTAPLQAKQPALRASRAGRVQEPVSSNSAFGAAAASLSSVVVAAASAGAVVSGVRRAQKREAHRQQAPLRLVAPASGSCALAQPFAGQLQTQGLRCGRIQRRLFFGDDSDPYEKCTAVKLQVGLQFSKTFLDTVNKLSETCNTDTEEGLHQLLLDVILTLRRAETSWRYASVERKVFDSDDPAREAGSLLQRWGLEGQTKFGDDNEWDKLDGKAPKGMTEYVVFTLMVSCFGPICGDDKELKVRSASDLKKILDALSGVQVDELVQLDCQWIPEEDGDSLSAMEVTMKFPELANI
eukprot:TRINITY_DN17678_c0_g1_i2.p1 TRINITY_DN17678_c0_g1~~TRINITY_DN17678_c0_g1_i2.p1  ORF type:complete len:829 (-),score=195.26 TRINITY_DN17678_c0_g1_i2:111-2597(-)